MRYVMSAILILLINATVSANNSAAILDIREQQASITAHLSLSGTTVTLDDSGTPQVSPVDQLEAILRVDTPDTYRVIMPEFSGATFGDFTLISQGKTHRQRGDSSVTTTTSWLIEPYNAGDYNLPPLTIRATAQEATDTLTLSLPQITVTSLPPSTTDLDILPARQLPSPLPWKTIIAVSAGVAVLILLFFVFKDAKRPRPLSPKQQALKALTELTGTERDKIAALSILIRHFLDCNFTMLTSGRTYAEYEPVIKKHPTILKADAILEILQTCDQGNYSGQQLSHETLDSLIQATSAFIEQSPEPLRPEEDTGTCGRW